MSSTVLMSSTGAVSHVMTRRQPGKGMKPAGRCQVNPGRAVRARTPDAAAPVRSKPGWDAGTRPGLVAALGGRARYRSRPPLGEASQTSPHAPCTQHRCEPVSSPSQAAQLVRSLLSSLPRRHERGTRRGTGYGIAGGFAAKRRRKPPPTWPPPPSRRDRPSRTAGRAPRRRPHRRSGCQSASQ